MPNITGDSLLRIFTPMTILQPLSHLLQELGDQLGRLLQVGHEGNHGVAVGLKHAVIGRADVAEIAAVDDYLDVLVLGRQPAENRLRLVVSKRCR